jgi:molybdopterin converting factor small subunit
VITIELPRALTRYAGDQRVVELDEPCATVGDALSALGTRSPGALDRVMDERGEVRPHVNVFVDGQSIRFLSGLATPLSEKTTILIVAAVSGG